ncbi:MAG: threonine synthase [Brevefilum sp.]|nr:threonine synthase [Brevefilum sp.]
MRVICHDCGKLTDFSLDAWRCSCGGAWEPVFQPGFDVNKLKTEDRSIWRYGELLGLDVKTPYQHMGVGWTPLVPSTLYGKQVHLKLEYLMPTGSFKDRGVNPMVNQLVHMGVKSMVEDSSGNAGASLAAHGARFGIPTQIFVPDYASPFKQHQIALYGVEMIKIAGTRKDTEDAAQGAVGSGRTYASHAYQPAYLAGQMTAAFEVWEQLDRKAPEWILCPVAQGGQFLGFWFGFSRLLAAGLIERIPRLVAVQSEKVAPLYQAWKAGLDDVPGIIPTGQTVAEGVSIAKPVRGKRLLQAVRESDGLVIAVKEEDIILGQQELAHSGYYVEPTSALVIAALKILVEEENQVSNVLLTLTGNGLKGSPKKHG